MEWRALHLRNRPDSAESYSGWWTCRAGCLDAPYGARNVQCDSGRRSARRGATVPARALPIAEVTQQSLSGRAGAVYTTQRLLVQ